MYSKMKLFLSLTLILALCLSSVGALACTAIYVGSGLTAGGETILQDPAGHIERGYQNLPEKLCALGAEIEKIEEYA